MQIRNLTKSAIMKVDKSSIFKVANAIRRSQNGLTIGEALKMAWKAAKLQIELAAGEVRFRYRKVNGEVREAVGTLKNMVTDTFSAFNGTAMFYFDIEKKGFRSFVVANLV